MVQIDTEVSVVWVIPAKNNQHKHRVVLTIEIGHYCSITNTGNRNHNTFVINSHHLQ